MKLARGVLGAVAVVSMSLVSGSVWAGGAGSTLNMTATEIVYRGPEAPVQVRLSEDPSDADAVHVDANVTMTTDTPECGGDVSSPSLVCMDSLGRIVDVTTFAAADTIEVLGTRTTEISAGGSADTVMTGAGADRIAGGGGDDAFSSGMGQDTLLGGGGDDSLFGGGEADTLRGGDGSDSVMAGGGSDSIFVRDGNVDFVGCGKGVDAVTADSKDRMISGCEVVER